MKIVNPKTIMKTIVLFSIAITISSCKCTQIDGSFNLKMTASALGNTNIDTVTKTEENPEIKNGDFTITTNETVALLIGDGKNDLTKWQLNFTQDANWLKFNTNKTLSSAILTLTLTYLGRFETENNISFEYLPEITLKSINYSN